LRSADMPRRRSPRRLIATRGPPSPASDAGRELIGDFLPAFGHLLGIDMSCLVADEALSRADEASNGRRALPGGHDVDPARTTDRLERRSICRGRSLARHSTCLDLWNLSGNASARADDGTLCASQGHVGVDLGEVGETCLAPVAPARSANVGARWTPTCRAGGPIRASDQRQRATRPAADSPGARSTSAFTPERVNKRPSRFTRMTRSKLLVGPGWPAAGVPLIPRWRRNVDTAKRLRAAAIAAAIESI